MVIRRPASARLGRDREERRGDVWWLAVAVYLVLLALPHAGYAAQATFMGLGFLPGGGYSGAEAVSADGSVVVGFSGSSSSATGVEAFRWTAAGGMVGLGDLPGDPFLSSAYGVSADGSVVVGEGYSPGPEGPEAFRWTAAGGMVGLGDLPGGVFRSTALGVSADGSVVVGYGDSASGPEAFRWTAAGGMVGLGSLPDGGTGSEAWDVSADGSVVVGYGDSASGFEAFRWTASGGMQGLGGLLTPPFFSIAIAVSDDGAVVVGASDADAFRWTAADGMVGIGSSRAWDVSADGSVVVGEYPAFVWDAQNGMRSLRAVLAASGADVDGWFLGSAYGVSADGRTIVGLGQNPNGQGEAWIAVLPEPECSDGLDNDGDGLVDFPADDGCVSAAARSEIRVDLDFNGVVDEGDRAAFAAAFGHAEGDPAYLPEGDFDGDGRITIVDYQRWLALYQQSLAARPPSTGCGLTGIELLGAVFAAWVIRRRRP